MKHFSLFAVAASLLILGTFTTQAQTRYTDAGSTSKFSIGIGAAPGISVPIGTLDQGDAAALSVAFRGGLNMTYPFSTEMSAFFNAGLDDRNLGVKEDTLLTARNYNVQYFFVQPGISYSSIGLSVNIGIPLSASEPVPRLPGLNVPVDSTQDVPTEQLNLLIEPRLNGTLTLMDNENYWLGLDLSVGIPVTALYKKDYQRPEEIDDGRTLIPATKPLTAHLGLTFQFGLFDAF